MSTRKPLNFQKWIDENRELLKPPVGNKCVYPESEDFIIMVVGGPNIRKDYHYNETEEFYYQIKGDIVVGIQENGKAVEVPIKEGEIFLLPPKVPHSPQRFKNTVGLVVERKRNIDELDGFQWYCDKCHEILYEKYFHLTDIVKQLPPLFAAFWKDENARTCNICNTYLEKP